MAVEPVTAAIGSTNIHGINGASMVEGAEQDPGEDPALNEMEQSNQTEAEAPEETTGRNVDIEA